MSELIQKVVASLQKDTDFEKMEDNICTAADVICRSVNSEYRSGFPEIDSQDITTEESKALEQALIDVMNRSDNVQIKTSAIWALGKSNDPQYKDLYIKYLQESLQSLLIYNKAVFETLSTLREIDKEAFAGQEISQGDRPHDSTGIDQIIRQAHEYLQKQQISVK